MIANVFIQSNSGHTVVCVTKPCMILNESLLVCQLFATRNHLFRERSSTYSENRSGCISLLDKYVVTFEQYNDLFLAATVTPMALPLSQQSILSRVRKVLSSICGGVTSINLSRVLKSVAEVHSAIESVLDGQDGNLILNQKLLDMNPHSSVPELSVKSEASSRWEKQLSQVHERFRGTREVLAIDLAINESEFLAPLSPFAGRTQQFVPYYYEYLPFGAGIESADSASTVDTHTHIETRARSFSSCLIDNESSM